MSNFLFILNGYLPYASANGVCVQKIAGALKSAGHNVSCLDGVGDDESEYEDINGVHVYRIRALWHERVCNWCNRRPTSWYSNALRSVALWSWRLKRIILFPFWPLSAPLYALKFYRRAKRICQDEHISCVVGVYQPFESLFAIALLKKAFPEIHTVAYLCDCLSGGVVPKIFPGSFCRAKLLKVEYRYIKILDTMLVLKSNEHYYANLYMKCDNVKKFQYVDIPFITKHENSYSTHNLNTLNIVYTGMLNKYIRDPSYAIDTMRRMTIKGNIIFYGNTDTHDYFVSHNVQSRYMKILYHNMISYVECEKVLRGTDILLNISNRNTRQVPSKIFEYMSFGKPIITFYKDDKDTSLAYLRRYPLSLLIKEDDEKIDENAALIEKFIRENIGKSVPFETVKELFPQNTPEYTAKILVELCGGGRLDE